MPTTDGDVTPPVASLGASPSLGMSPLSPFRRQFPSSFMRASPPVSEPDKSEPQLRDHTLDSKDFLIQRLNDLVAKLSGEELVGEGNVDTLHAKVDEMEKVLQSSPRSKRRRRGHTRSFLDSRANSDDISSMSSSISWIRPPFLETDHFNAQTLVSEPASELKNQSQTAKSKDGKREAISISPDKAEQFLLEAQKLRDSLNEVAASLEVRHEESEHLHEHNIMRLERAAQRIIYLEGRVKELESERDEGEMEILNLQIQLKAIEVQCLSYVPKDFDPDLRKSIETWKAELSALRRKRTRMRENDLESTLGTPTRRGPRVPVNRSRAVPG